MNEAALPLPMPTNEREVIDRLKNPPTQMKITATQSPDSGLRHWVVITYDFIGKLPKLGKFLMDIASDVFQAGGVVTQFKMDSLRPANDDPDDYKPSGPWREMHIHASIKTRAETEANAAAWRDAIKSLFGKK